MRRRHVRFDVDFKSLFQVGMAHQFLLNFCLRSEPLHPGAVTVPEGMPAHVSESGFNRGGSDVVFQNHTLPAGPAGVGGKHKIRVTGVGSLRQSNSAAARSGSKGKGLAEASVLVSSTRPTTMLRLTRIVR